MSETEATARQEPAKPDLRIITESTTPEEVAAIVTVLASLGGGAPAAKPKRSLWATPSLRGAPHAGPGAWRASGLPR